MIAPLRLGAALLLPLVSWGQAAAAETQAVTSSSQIEAALARPRASQEEPAPADKPKTRGLSIRATTETRETTHTVEAAAPVVNLSIPFEYNSAELRPESIAQLVQLEAALRSAALARNRFLVAGHTDASGNAGYNRELSQRRAAAVKRFLVASGIDAERLDSMGQGEDQLLLPDRPDDARNRRVEIRNLGELP